MSSVTIPLQCPAQSVGPLNSMVTALVQALLAAQCAISPPDAWPTDYADQALQYGLDTYDFVVVGAGSAGSVIASRLSENPNLNVLVLEAGGDPPQESEIPYLFSTVTHTSATWNYYSEISDKDCLGSNNSRCYLPRGKIIGGTGAINGMLYLRGNRRDYDGWAEAGNAGWGWDDILPYFQRSVTPAGSAEDPKGYVVLNNFPVITKNVEDMIFGGAAELGVPIVDEINNGNDIGYTHAKGTYADGLRVSTGKSYLAKVAGRPNLHVIKNAHVTKLNFDECGKKVRSVGFTVRGEYEMEVTIDKELVLSAGAIGSAQLLMLSGVGPAQHLNELDIPLVRDLPVGENFQDHVIVPTFTTIEANAANPLTRGESLDKIYDDLIHRTGPYATVNTNALIGYINTLKDSPYPDIEYHHFYFKRGDLSGFQVFVNAFGYNSTIVAPAIKALANADVLVVLNVLMFMNSRGNIRLQSNDYRDSPKITTNYLTESEEKATLLRSIRFQEQLLNTAAYKAQNATLVLPAIEECNAYQQQSDDYWHCYFKYLAASGYHFIGTVKMAPETDETSCVNPRLQVNGFDNLRVADASIMPKIPSGNTNAPTIMIAEKVVDFIREDWQV